MGNLHLADLFNDYSTGQYLVVNEYSENLSFLRKTGHYIGYARVRNWQTVNATTSRVWHDTDITEEANWNNGNLRFLTYFYRGWSLLDFFGGMWADTLSVDLLATTRYLSIEVNSPLALDNLLVPKHQWGTGVTYYTYVQGESTYRFGYYRNILPTLSPKSQQSSNGYLALRPPLNFLKDNCASANGLGLGNTIEIKFKANASTVCPFFLQIEDGTRRAYVKWSSPMTAETTWTLSQRGSSTRLYRDGTLISGRVVFENSSNNRMSWGWGSPYTPTKVVNAYGASASIDFVRYTTGMAYGITGSSVPTGDVQSTFTGSTQLNLPSVVSNIVLSEQSRRATDGSYIPQIVVSFTPPVALGNTFMIYHRIATMATWTLIGTTADDSYTFDTVKGGNVVKIVSKKGGVTTDLSSAPMAFLSVVGEIVTVTAPPVSSYTGLLLHFDDSLSSTGNTPPAESSAIAFDPSGWNNSCIRFATASRLSYASELPNCGSLTLKVKFDQSVLSMTDRHYVLDHDVPAMSIYVCPTDHHIKLEAYDQVMCSNDASAWTANDWHTISASWNYLTIYKSFALVTDTANSSTLTAIEL